MPNLNPHTHPHFSRLRGETSPSKGRGESETIENGPRRKELSMPKRKDIKKVMIIGSGPIVIGQACEFDYSGT